ncbi:MAG: hypothetical protein JWM69_1456 [Candidatus Binatus sp.]|nr:hypothetical protein [Candidatus Binatus sp.]
MRILYTETTAYYPSSAHFIEALEDLRARGECEFHFLDEAEFIKPARSFAGRIARRVAGWPPRGYRELNSALAEQTARFRPDVILIGKGRHFAPATLKAAKHLSGATLVNWATDDPFNRADNSRDLIESIPIFDLYLSSKFAAMSDIARAGCANVAYVKFGYKPSVHFRDSAATDAERDRFSCDVMFAGGCDRDRAPYFEALVRAIPEIDLHLYGAYWDRIPALRRYSRGFANGRDYRLAIGGAKISVNLVRRANRDDHVMRTFEIPACGGFTLTESTPIHRGLFADGVEAALFGSIDEFVVQVKSYLAREDDRDRIADAGYRKIVHGNHSYADRLSEILTLVRQLRVMRRADSRERSVGFESQ